MRVSPRGFGFHLGLHLGLASVLDLDLMTGPLLPRVLGSPAIEDEAANVGIVRGLGDAPATLDMLDEGDEPAVGVVRLRGDEGLEDIHPEDGVQQEQELKAEGPAPLVLRPAEVELAAVWRRIVSVLDPEGLVDVVDRQLVAVPRDGYYVRGEPVVARSLGQQVQLHEDAGGRDLHDEALEHTGADAGVDDLVLRPARHFLQPQEHEPALVADQGKAGAASPGHREALAVEEGLEEARQRFRGPRVLHEVEEEVAHGSLYLRDVANISVYSKASQTISSSHGKYDESSSFISWLYRNCYMSFCY